MTAKTAIRKKKNMGRSTDLSLAWITEEYGDEWSAWRKLASEWLMSMDKGLSKPLASIGMLIGCYLAPEISWASDVTSFFKGHPNTNALPTSDALEAAILKRTNQKHSNKVIYFETNADVKNKLEADAIVCKVKNIAITENDLILKVFPV